MMTMNISPLAREIRGEISRWLTRHDPQTAAALTADQYGELILDRAAIAVADSLRRGLVIQREPAAADPAKGDRFYLMEGMDEPGRLRTALVENLAGDQDYWDYQMRHAPNLDPIVEETPDGGEPPA
jgi:hypothetical protein